MNANKEKFLALATETDEDFMKEVEYRINNRAWLTESFGIAVKILVQLEELKWTQKDLAKAMSVSPQQINKIVHGKQNLKLETLLKLQTILDIPVMASYLENKAPKKEELKLPGTNVSLRATG